jgi:arylsulfatase
MRFTDYYAEASCTAGRANFITGELPIRTGLTTVGQAGSALGMPAEAPTIATALKALGYATGQFGKNHLGDRNEFLPTAHGFDEYFGYLYHLNAMEDPFWNTYPPEWKATVGPRNLIHSWATEVDDPTVEPRWGKVGKQKIVDEGPLPPNPVAGITYNMTTFDEVISASDHCIHGQGQKRRQTVLRVDESHAGARQYLLVAQVRSHTQPGDGFWLEEAALKQMDDNVGVVLTWLKENGLEQNTIVVFTTDNGAESYTWPDGGTTPFAGAKGEVTEGSFRALRSFAGPAACNRAPSQTASSRVSTGFRPWWQPPATPTSRRSCSRANHWATGPTRCISTAMTRPT